MKIIICDLCKEREETVLGALTSIKDYYYGLSCYQLCFKCKINVDCHAGKFIRRGIKK